MYVVWIRIDETLPWIELKGEYQTRKAAKKAAKEFLKSAKVKIVKTRGKSARVKVLATAKASC
ncbi:MAG: hypothetical protein QW667_06055 [Candidatus Bathyarchaeia archaeon]